MRYDDLLRAATESAPGASGRAQHAELAARLSAANPSDPITLKGVAKWFERGSIPGKWLMRIAALTKPPLNISNFA